jgi:hypothetical protein
VPVYGKQVLTPRRQEATLSILLPIVAAVNNAAVVYRQEGGLHS